MARSESGGVVTRAISTYIDVQDMYLRDYRFKGYRIDKNCWIIC